MVNFYYLDIHYMDMNVQRTRYKITKTFLSGVWIPPCTLVPNVARFMPHHKRKPCMPLQNLKVISIEYAF